MEILPALPPETSRRSFLQIIPLLKAFAEYNKLVLAPIPRYLYSSCCDDHEHAPNIKMAGYPDSQVAEIEEHQRMWRGICFREKARNTKVVSAGHLVKESTWWDGDPVHPNMEGYKRFSKFITQGLRSLEDKRLHLMQEDEVKEGKKRSAEAQPAGSSANPAKRPAASDRDYVSREDPPWRFQRGRGGHGGRRGGMFFRTRGSFYY
jgi:hypothetical protein